MMLERRDTGMERCSKGGNKKRSKLGMKERRDSGLDGFIIHERRDSRLEGYGKEGIQERRETGKRVQNRRNAQWHRDESI